MSAPDPLPEDDWSALAAQLQAAEQAVQELRERYAYARTNSRQREEVQQRYTELQTELEQLSQRLEQLDAELESHLFTWNSLREPFWQALRFGGLGFALGFLLKGYLG